MKTLLHQVKTSVQLVGRGEQWRAAIGAGLSIALTGWICQNFGSKFDSSWPWLMAPLGASAVLVFAIHTSPLARPWVVTAGNTVCALIGVTCVQYLGDAPWVAGLAVCLSILVMFSLRCLHPPGGAIALLVVLSHQSSYGYVIFPVLVNTVLLVALGLLINRMTGKSYPHRVKVEALSASTLTYELEQVLRKHNEVLDISIEDLQLLIEEVTQLRWDTTPKSEIDIEK
jgi:CBS domain-containing membrane protein